MKKLLITHCGVFAVSAALPVFASPDRQPIEQARKVKADRMPLDHGSRAQTPSPSNLQRLRRAGVARANG